MSKVQSTGGTQQVSQHLWSERTDNVSGLGPYLKKWVLPILFTDDDWPAEFHLHCVLLKLPTSAVSHVTIKWQAKYYDQIQFSVFDKSNVFT